MTDSGARSYRLNLNDPGTLDDLIRTYAEPLVRYAYCIIGTSSAAEDAMEDAFAALIAGRYHFRSEPQLRAWLYRTTHNKAVDYIRRHKREVPLCDVENVLQSADLEHQMALQERNRIVYTCMQQLPVQYREVLQLVYFDQFGLDEVCTILRKSKKQVYNLLSRAKIALKDLLMKEGITREEL